MQVFKLPRPVLCIGGVLQVELLGRVQTQQMDQLYYIWYFAFANVCHIVCSRFFSVFGAAFCVDIDRFTLFDYSERL